MPEEIRSLRKMGMGVGVMILRDNKILLGHRHYDPTKADSVLNGADTWAMPGGKIDFGESFEQAAVREVREEIGAIIDPVKLKLISVTNDIVPQAHFVTIGFLYEDFEGEARIMEPDEITDWQWFDLNQLPGKVFFPCVKILQNYRAGKVYLA